MKPFLPHALAIAALLTMAMAADSLRKAGFDHSFAVTVLAAAIASVVVALVYVLSPAASATRRKDRRRDE